MTRYTLTYARKDEIVNSSNSIPEGRNIVNAPAKMLEGDLAGTADDGSYVSSGNRRGNLPPISDSMYGRDSVELEIVDDAVEISPLVFDKTSSDIFDFRAVMTPADIPEETELSTNPKDSFVQGRVDSLVAEMGQTLQDEFENGETGEQSETPVPVEEEVTPPKA